jgi:hypothetical protein
MQLKIPVRYVKPGSQIPCQIGCGDLHQLYAYMALVGPSPGMSIQWIRTIIRIAKAANVKNTRANGTVFFSKRIEGSFNVLFIRLNCEVNKFCL